MFEPTTAGPLLLSIGVNPGTNASVIIIIIYQIYVALTVLFM